MTKNERIRDLEQRLSAANKLAARLIEAAGGSITVTARALAAEPYVEREIVVVERQDVDWIEYRVQ